MVTSREPFARPWLDAFLQRLRMASVGIDQGGAGIAADAVLRYGKGRGHPARLNFADRLSYAAAKQLQAPLLYKGGDFSQTDIQDALSA